MVPFILKSTSITLFPVGESPLVIDSEHMNFAAVAEAIRDGDFDAALDLASVKSYLNTISGGRVSVNDEGVFFGTEQVTGYLATKMQQFFREGIPMEHYCKFLDNLMSNPSMVSRKELYLFLEAADLPITEDGCFLAYKAVAYNFKDKHSRTFDNSPGTTHSMPRSQVDDDRERTCSYGFHAAAYQYASGFMGYGDKMVAVKINPADVVSVPSDYNNQKLRTCKYVVMFEISDAGDVFKDRAFMNTSRGPTATYDEANNSFMYGLFDEDDDTY